MTLTYARWAYIAVIGLFFGGLAAGLRPHAESYNPTLLSAAGGVLGLYAVINIVLWLRVRRRKETDPIRPRGFVVDTLLIAVACFLASLAVKVPLFAFCCLPVIGISLLVGIGPAAVAMLVGAAATFAFLLITPFSAAPASGGTDALTSRAAITSYCIIATAFVGVIALRLITRKSRALVGSANALINTVMDEYHDAMAADQNRRIEALFRMAKILSETLDYKQVSDAILTEIQALFGISTGALMTFKTGAATDTLVMDNGVGLTSSEMRAQLGLNAVALRAAALKAEPKLITDVAANADLLDLLPSLRGSTAIMIAPLRGGYESYGVLLIASTRSIYTPLDLNLFNTMAAHIGIAMQNAQLYYKLFEDRNKILTAEEEVRRELNRNLHDGPAQAVASFAMQTEYIRRLFENEPQKALDELVLLGKQAQQTSKEIRNLLFALRPLVLETQGLVSALEQFANSLNQTPGSSTSIHVTNAGLTRRFNPKVETAIFTIVQEAVNNARKHARARNIWARVEMANSMLTAIVQDDGVGFDLALTQSTYNIGKSYGLSNMQERAALIGGSIRLESAPGQGTRIMLYIPITDKVFEGAAADDNPTQYGSAAMATSPAAALLPPIELAAANSQHARRRMFGGNGKTATAVAVTGELPPPPSLPFS